MDMMKELNRTDVLVIPNCVELFKTYDIEQNHYITLDNLHKRFFEANSSNATRKKFIKVIRKLKITPNYELNFLDFLKIMNEVRGSCPSK